MFSNIKQLFNDVHVHLLKDLQELQASQKVFKLLLPPAGLNNGA